MRDYGFRVRVTALSDNGSLVSVRGDIDIATSPTLRRLLAAVQACRHRDPADGRIVVDLSRVTLLDASGLSVLMEAARSADRNGHAFVLRRPSRSCVRALEITRLASVFRIDEGPPCERTIQLMSA
jgi:anti-anti-sigma factor